MERADVGIEPNDLAGITLRASPLLEDPVARGELWVNVLNRIRSTPGVHAATLATTLRPERRRSRRGEPRYLSQITALAHAGPVR